MEGKRQTTESLRRGLDHAHMVYLGLPPVVATFSLLYSYGHLRLHAATAQHGRPLAFAVNGFLIDGTAVWISILVLALCSDLPTRGQRWASVGIMVVALVAATYSLAWPYCRDVLQGGWGGASLLLLALGAAQGAFTRYRLYERENMVRDDDAAAVYIVVFIFAWLASLIAGNVLHEVSRRS